MGQDRKSPASSQLIGRATNRTCKGKSLAAHVNLAADDAIYRANRGGLECQITLWISIKCRTPIR